MEFKGTEIIIDYSQEYDNGQPVIEFYEKETGEPYLTATTNLQGIDLEENEILIKDYSENEGVLAFLEENKIVEFTGKYIHSGWVGIPVCKLLIKI
jgi:hypothetical protein